MRQKLMELLGDFPDPPPLQTETLESVEIEGGRRDLIEYVSELEDPCFDRPAEKVRAYLFVPHHKQLDQFPAIIAIHQDGPRSDLGKNEPAGLDGDGDQHFGIELFRRGYVVICPDRIGHAGRRRSLSVKDEQRKPERADSHYAGQLLLAGRNLIGKEAYDLMRAADVLCGLDYVDQTRLGAIGHSAGGYELVFFMFVDERIKAGVSSCGFFEILEDFHEDAPMKRSADSVIPGLAKVGKAADYLAYVAPRPVLMTRGLWEWGTEGIWGQFSKDHVKQTKTIEEHARDRYVELSASDALKVIYFEENGGNHAFPPQVKEEAYRWLDNQLG